MPTHTHVRNKKHASRLNIARYFGLKVVVNELEKWYNVIIPIVNFETVNNYDIVLFSCLSTDDYYSLVYTVEKKMKGIRKGIWIAGGPAISNINPFINYFEYIVLGRGEDIIIPLIEAVRNDQVYVHKSVVYSPEYSPDKLYFTNYAKQLYPDKIDNVQETMYGCKYNCTYCRYRTATLPPAKRDFDKGTTMPGNEETFWDLDIKNGSFYTTSLDGLTEKIRYAVQKPIKNVAVIDGFEKWSKQTKIINLKVYFIIGYPYNPDFDLTELKETFIEVSKVIGQTKVFVSLHFTPFGADPSTPMQWEAVNVQTDYREIISKLKLNSNYLFESDNLRVIFLTTTMQPLALFKRMLFARMELKDIDLIRYVGSHTSQITHNSNSHTKFELIKNKYDISRFTDEKQIGSKLPSQNIIVWKSIETMMKEGNTTRNKLKSMSNKYL